MQHHSILYCLQFVCTGFSFQGCLSRFTMISVDLQYLRWLTELLYMNSRKGENMLRLNSIRAGAFWEQSGESKPAAHWPWDAEFGGERTVWERAQREGEYGDQKDALMQNERNGTSRWKHWHGDERERFFCILSSFDFLWILSLNIYLDFEAVFAPASSGGRVPNIGGKAIDVLTTFTMDV